MATQMPKWGVGFSPPDKVTLDAAFAPLAHCIPCGRGQVVALHLSDALSSETGIARHALAFAKASRMMLLVAAKSSNASKLTPLSHKMPASQSIAASSRMGARAARSSRVVRSNAQEWRWEMVTLRPLLS